MDLHDQASPCFFISNLAKLLLFVALAKEELLSVDDRFIENENIEK